jgi:D-3-phosphoglycerate dehydrogenase
MPQAHVWSGNKLHPSALAVLEGLATVTISSVGERGNWYPEAEGADAVLVSGTIFVTGEVMDRVGPRLRIVARTGIGFDRVNLEAATERGILVLNTPDGPTESTAEHAIALMLNLSKRVAVTDRILRAGSEFPKYSEMQPGLEVCGATLGLVGLGRIGSRVAEIACVLGMRVLAYDPFITAERAQSLGVTLVGSLEELLPQVKVLSLHSPATLETRHMLNAQTLALLPRGSYLINVARGALVDEAALLEALETGHLAGAGLDVFDPEPPPANAPLFRHPNTICTPHIGSFTAEGLLRMQVMACQEVATALRGERPQNLVNPQVWEKRRR